MRVMIVVTHLLGTGHLVRALNIARACVDAGHSVTLVSGGMPVVHLDFTGVNLVQLPPLRSDGVDFTRLLTSDGSVASALRKQAATEPAVASTKWRHPLTASWPRP